MVDGWRWSAMILTVLVVLAGCTSSPPETVSPTPQTEPPTSSPTETSDGNDETSVSSDTPTDSATPTPTPTASPTPTQTPYLNPWHTPELIVAVDDDAVAAGRNVVPLVQQAITYWEGEGSEYADYPVSFVLDVDAENPDLLVEFKSDVICDGGNGTAIGCAPVIEADDTVSTSVEIIEVETGYVNATTLKILKHEFGHVLGVEHEDPPEDIMAARTETTAVSAPNASERLFPWQDRNLTVYIQDENINLGGVEPIRRQQIHDALKFYESDRDDGWLENITFTLVDKPTEADIVIRATPNPGCESGSCGEIFGHDTDADAPLEYYTFTSINVSTATEDNHYAWYVAYWLGFSLGADEYKDLPDDLRKGERSGSWWSE